MFQPHPDHRGIKIISKATGTVSGVKRKVPDEGHRTLGFFFAGDGSSNAHKIVMPKKSRDMPRKLHIPTGGMGRVGWHTTHYTWKACHT
jgi:hypothetical protein